MQTTLGCLLCCFESPEGLYRSLLPWCHPMKIPISISPRSPSQEKQYPPDISRYHRGTMYKPPQVVSFVVPNLLKGDTNHCHPGATLSNFQLVSLPGPHLRKSSTRRTFPDITVKLCANHPRLSPLLSRIVSRAIPIIVPPVPPYEKSNYYPSPVPT